MEKTGNKKPLKPILGTISGIVFVSTASILIRFAQAEASSIVIAASRLVIATIVLIPIGILKYRHQWEGLSPKEIFKAILSGIFLALHFSFWITSLEYTSIASSVVLVTTTPLWVAILSPLVLKETIRKQVIIGLIISMAGSVIVGLANACTLQSGGFVCKRLVFTERAMIGNFLALSGAWMAAGYMLIGRQLRKKLNTVSYTGLVYGIAGLILVVVVLISREPIFSYSGKTYLWLIAIGILPQLLGHSLLNWALKYISAAYVALTLLGEPIFTVILALIFLRESPTLLEGMGAGLILLGIIAASTRQMKPFNGA